MFECEADDEEPKVEVTGDDAKPSEGGEGDAKGDKTDSPGDKEYQMETAPFDPRFPNQNQTKHCYTSFLDHKRCVKLRGADFQPCEYFKRVYQSLCPNSWVAKWEEQIEGGTFPGKI